MRLFLRHRSVRALLALTLLGGLCGCNKLLPPPSDDIVASEDYKALHPADVKDLDNPFPQVASEVDVTTGKPVDDPTPRRLDLDKIPEPTDNTAVSTKIVADDPQKEMTEGERQPGWTGLYDIYWKLNWIRKELLSSNVPNNLRPVVARTRKHSQRIRTEFSDHSIDKFLDIADQAMDHLDLGLDQMANCQLLTDANISWRSLPWNDTDTEIRSWLEIQGALPSSRVASASSGSSSDDDDEDAHRSRFVPTPSGAFIGSEKRKAAMFALEYARQHHTSPVEQARKEFESALRDILRLRDKMELKYAQPSVPGDSFLIAGELHQEPGGLIDRPDHYAPTDMDRANHPGASNSPQIP